ncbi:GTPase-activating protein AGE2 [Maudiozyma barnettii]|uniref:Similar to Saccharomyces cerevisiae YIL044C AGE2 ADP-ribosylation factor (ARF) GTPase activating protein (GAP) effector, involved in Trans-Golgi- Network (TGN) transport n=1 Tax=Maudiozyma barnettii TaxID=61262 RepID=A0A8H2VB58_9SACH|nr:GTPase-activating protein AGE2 [Kazachstania barnettii]CAB4252047.1 similar to Saccharomyces cerevisiae YIL044C AGE2 ADP-ribosylation factor (ARF) GTPase activating protein (GAP) effector, involved in Trans-Golgi- Network (TGN) transport [Kazachstania barnettii]
MTTAIPVKKAIGALLRDPGNSICADCKSQSHPRWASWSLGVFICIRCAGVHRSLGTHVSKVKSVDLDTWKEEHLRMLIRMQNNDIANLYYECRLSDEIKSNLKQSLLDTNKLQTFIRAKYEAKKWIGDSIPNKKDLSLMKENLLDNNNNNNNNNNGGSNSSSVSSLNVAPISNDLLNDSMNKLNISNSSKNNSLVNLEKLSSSISNGSTSNNNTSNTASSNTTTTTNTNTNINANSKLNQRPDLKKSILSLYSKSNTNVRNPANIASNNNNNNTSLSGISSLASSTTKLNNNNSSSTWSSTINNNNNNSNSALSLDDNELFKNVWS